MKPTKFEISDYLDDPQVIVSYLNTVLEEGTSDELIVALGHITKAIGMTKIAEKTGMSRPSLYKALYEGAKPQFETIHKVLKAIGGQIQVKVSGEKGKDLRLIWAIKQKIIAHLWSAPDQVITSTINILPP